MKKAEFDNMIAAYGANSIRWPEDRRTAGERYLQANPEAQTLVHTEAVLDEVLDYASTAEPSDILKARIMKAATGKVNTLSKESAPRQYWKLAASFVAVLAIGGLTYSAYTASTPTVSEDESAIWLEAANDLGVSDIYEWVEGTE